MTLTSTITRFANIRTKSGSSKNDKSQLASTSKCLIPKRHPALKNLRNSGSASSTSSSTSWLRRSLTVTASRVCWGLRLPRNKMRSWLPTSVSWFEKLLGRKTTTAAQWPEMAGRCPPKTESKLQPLWRRRISLLNAEIQSRFQGRCLLHVSLTKSSTYKNRARPISH